MVQNEVKVCERNQKEDGSKISYLICPIFYDRTILRILWAVQSIEYAESIKYAGEDHFPKKSVEIAYLESNHGHQGKSNCTLCFEELFAD